jgi:hypothetical protein
MLQKPNQSTQPQIRYVDKTIHSSEGHERQTYSGVISTYQIVCPHPQGLPICPAPPQVEQVEE